MVRHTKSAAVWNWPLTLASRSMGFGLCSGTASPYGVASPANFIGMKTAATWNRLNLSQYWTVGWQLITRRAATETVITSGADGTLRVGGATEWQQSAWYLRFRRAGTSAIGVQLFLPTGPDPVDFKDFDKQMRLTNYSTSVNRHSGFSQVASVTIDPQEATYGYLDTFNIFSNPPVETTAELSGVEWCEVKAVLLE